MINKNSLKDIIQIYEFIKERPNYLGKSQFEKIKELLVELNESSNVPIRVVSQIFQSFSELQYPYKLPISQHFESLFSYD